jgi:xanthine dehydrogenase accessory factor
MEVWSFIKAKLNALVNVQLLYVVKSEGSSPGRQGFKMAVAADGSFCGTIGGGIMEYKLVEKAKNLLVENSANVLLQQQFHDKEHSTNQSGMICSGSQVNVFIPLTIVDSNTIESIIKEEKQTIFISPSGITVSNDNATGFQYLSDAEWKYSEPIKKQRVIHIIGGGHTGLALSELMSFLGFYIYLYDDRKELNTIEENKFANEKIVVAYETIGDTVTTTKNDYVVIMTIGYRTDKIVLKQLIDKPFFYLGLLGSAKKIEQLFTELKAEGVAEEKLNTIFSPVGLNIHSKTTREIAVSIAAEIICEKNKELSTCW